MTELERLQKAKIPCPETGIEIRHTVCDICTPGPQCASCLIKDEKSSKWRAPMVFHNDGVLPKAPQAPVYLS